MSDVRLNSPIPIDDDLVFEAGLRPKRLDEFVGQRKIKENLSVFIEAARRRGEALDHVLLYGRRDWGRPPWPTSLPTSWELGSGAPRGRLSSGRGTWRRY